MRGQLPLYLPYVLFVLCALWFLIYGIAGVSARPVPNIGWWLGVLALIIGICLLILCVEWSPGRVP
jgi:uncharacterized membrane protein HdeD (DUF308 family)